MKPFCFIFPIVAFFSFQLNAIESSELNVSISRAYYLGGYLKTPSRLLDLTENLLNKATLSNSVIITGGPPDDIEPVKKDTGVSPVNCYPERVYRGCGSGDYYINGCCSRIIIETYIETSIDTTLLPEPVYNAPYTIEPSVFPNPTQSFANLSFEVEQEEEFEIILYNSNGQVIQNIHSGLIDPGLVRFEIDLTEQNSGMYLIQIQSKRQAEILKLIRVN